LPLRITIASCSSNYYHYQQAGNDELNNVWFVHDVPPVV